MSSCAALASAVLFMLCRVRADASVGVRADWPQTSRDWAAQRMHRRVRA